MPQTPVIGFVVLLVFTILVFIGGGALASRLSGPSVIERVIAWQVATLTVLVTCLVVAGTAWFLRPVPVAAEYVGVCAVLVVVCGPRRLWRWFGQLGRDLGRAAADGWRGPRRPWVVVLAVVSLVELVWRLTLVAILPPYSYDALNHHLVEMAVWLQHGGFAANPFNFEPDPSNTELVFAHIALFTHQAQFIGVTQVFFSLFASTVTIGLARLLGASRTASVVAGMVFFLTPVVLAQSTTAYDDIAAVSEFAACLYFVTRYLRLLPSSSTETGHRTARLLVLAGLAAALCLGSRPQTPIWISAVAVVLGANIVWAAYRGWVSPWRAVGAAGTFAAVTAAFGVYWYVRDHVVHFHSVELVTSAVPLTESSRFPLSIARSWAHDLVPFLHSAELFYRYDQRSGGYGPVWLFVMVPLLALSAIEAFRRRDRVLGSVLAIAGLAWIRSPDSWWTRLTLELVVVGAAVTAVWLTRWSTRRLGTVVGWAMTAMVLVGVALSTWQYQLGNGQPINDPHVIRLAGASPDARTLNLGGYNVVDRVPSGALIALDPNNVALGFVAWGMHFQHRVVAVDLSGPGAAAQLKASGAQYVFVAVGPDVARAAQVPVDDVQQVAAGGGFVVYRIGSP